MAYFGNGLCCENSFKDFNQVFRNGVTPEIAAAIGAVDIESKEPGQLYSMDMDGFDASVITHFERDWLGIGGESWFGPEAGKLIYKAFVAAIQSAGKRQIKAVWVESDTVAVQTLTDERLILLLVGSKRPAGNAHSGGDSGTTVTL